MRMSAPPLCLAATKACKTNDFISVTTSLRNTWEDWATIS
jgi:hypothetical protein